MHRLRECSSRAEALQGDLEDLKGILAEKRKEVDLYKNELHGA